MGETYGMITELCRMYEYVLQFRYHLRALTNYHFQPFTDFFPCANINQLLTPDILHQVIKGVFKDHLVAWVEEYLLLTHKSKTKVAQILSDIDRR